jgi:hypothetical protein
VVTIHEQSIDVRPAVNGVADPDEPPMMAPVHRALTWERIHRLSQSPSHSDAQDERLIAGIRDTATVRRGTRMTKVVSLRQVAAYLHGRLISGFCYRMTDVADLGEADTLAVLLGDAGGSGSRGDPVFALRWRAVDASDYDVPLATAAEGRPSYPGLTRIPPHDRWGPPVIGTGFAPSSGHLVPEFVTADLTDLPLPVNTLLVAHTADGEVVPLYSYLPEQRAWLRLYGAQWRHLVAHLPEIAPDQEYVQIAAREWETGPRLVGRFLGEEHEAIADPPHEFRVATKGKGVRFRVTDLTRRVPYATWRGATCTVIHGERGWLRLRLCRPDAQNIHALGAQCMERGSYEAWAPAAEVDLREVDKPYDIT